jgi:DNA-binding Lrp family transcriptional regulator
MNAKLDRIDKNIVDLLTVDGRMILPERLGASLSALFATVWNA